MIFAEWSIKYVDLVDCIVAWPDRDFYIKKSQN